jgi:hypothetical protein
MLNGMFNTTKYLNSNGCVHLCFLCSLTIHIMTTAWKKVLLWCVFIVNHVCMKYIIIIYMIVWISINILRVKILKIYKLFVLILMVVCDFLWLINESLFPWL